MQGSQETYTVRLLVDVRDFLGNEWKAGDVVRARKSVGTTLYIVDADSTILMPGEYEVVVDDAEWLDFIERVRI